MKGLGIGDDWRGFEEKDERTVATTGMRLRKA